MADLQTRYELTLKQVKLFCEQSEDDDYTIQLESKAPADGKKGYIRLTAEDFEFSAADLEMFSGATRFSLQTEEIETDDDFSYCPVLTLWF